MNLLLFLCVVHLFPASMSLVLQPIGSLLSAVVSDSSGRRKAMMLVNVPIAIGWLLMLYESNHSYNIFAANMLLEFGCALMESPTVTYVTEIRYFCFSNETAQFHKRLKIENEVNGLFEWFTNISWTNNVQLQRFIDSLIQVFNFEAFSRDEIFF